MTAAGSVSNRDFRSRKCARTHDMMCRFAHRRIAESNPMLANN
jgi:hypothetical protein